MATTSITIRMEEDLKKQFEVLVDSMGMNMTTAFNIFAKMVVRQNRIPFDIVGDPFYSESNQRHLLKVIEDLNSGKNIVTKTMEELEAMENE